MASILVTGGAGFIGSNLCRSLLAQGHSITAVDNLITGRLENLVPFRSNPKFLFHEVDIASQTFITLFDDAPLDFIYHLACPTGVPNLQRLGVEMLHTCSYGVYNVLELAKKHTAKLLFTSSAEIYGQPERFPQDETYTGNVDPLGPRNAYEEGKRFSEACLSVYVRTHKLDARIVRIFNTYGPGMSLNDSRVIPQFMSSVINRRPLRIYGDGTQTRTHLFVDDLVRGLELVMANGSAGEAYNVGGDRSMTVHDLAKLIISLIPNEIGVTFEPHFIEDHRHRRPSTEKVKALGWRQEISLEQGLKRMIAHYLPQVESDVETPLSALPLKTLSPASA